MTGNLPLRALAWPAFFLLAALCACSHHQPAPVQEYSSASSKPRLSADGSYEVKPGDTLYAIAFSFDLETRELAEWNDISRPYIIYPGQKLRLSAPVSAASGKRKAAGVKLSGLGERRPAASRTPAEPQTARPATAPPKRPASAATAPPAVPGPAPALQDPQNWQWPTSGRVLRNYVAGNPARNGLDIGGREGQAVSASAGGQVVYSGRGLIGYGELIIIKHNDRMLSAYAHNKVRLVQEGAQVSAGQKIAEMGRNAANEQLLHFEIRVHGKPVNPLNYLPRK